MGLEHGSKSCLDELSKIIITRRLIVCIDCAVIDYPAYCKSILQLKCIRISFLFLELQQSNCEVIHPQRKYFQRHCYL